MPALSRKSTAIGLLLIGVGVIFGLVVASDLGWRPCGHAVPDAPTAPKTAAVLPAAGADRNFVEVAKAVTPTVVNISTTRISRLPEGHAGGAPFDDPFFKRFFGDELFRRFEAPKDRRERSLGSGVIADANGYIITNNHVVSKADDAVPDGGMDINRRKIRPAHIKFITFPYLFCAASTTIYKAGGKNALVKTHQGSGDPLIY